MTTQAISISLDRRQRRERERVALMLNGIRTLARGLILFAAFWTLVAIGSQAFSWIPQVDAQIDSAMGVAADPDRWVQCVRTRC